MFLRSRCHPCSLTLGTVFHPVELDFFLRTRRGLFQREAGTAGEVLPQRFALEVLHCEEELVVLGAAVVEQGDGMGTS